MATLAGIGATSGRVGAQEKPDFGGYLSDANVVSIEDRRGESEVTVEVGAGGQGLAFAPTGLWIDPGTTVRFEWTGDGGGHNVVPDRIPYDSDWDGSEEVVSDAGVTYEHTFTVEGGYGYYCQPHQQLGMLGAIAVGDESGGTRGERPDFDYVSWANGGSYADMRGESAATVEVGAGENGLAFAPTGLWVDPGTTVRFEWTGSGAHSVVPDEVPEESDWRGQGETIVEAGFTHEHTFEAEGVYRYYCEPHEQLGMVGAVAVGDEVPTVGTGAEEPTTDSRTTTTAADGTGTAMVGGDGGTESEETPGFGVAAALAGLGVVTWRRLRRR